ncbi:MAG: biotin biosynthesis protein BioC [Rickettsiales bacterium]|nr:biotin biosynthesis protein BioC [Rickettsiales bacterium]
MLKKKSNAGVLHDFRSFVVFFRDVAIGLFRLANFQDLKKKAEELIQESALIRKKLENIAQSNYDLGVYHTRQGNYSDAMMRFKLVCKFKPDEFPGAYYHLGRITLLSSETPNAPEIRTKAREFFLKALSLKPEFPEADFALKRLDNPASLRSIPPTLIREDFDAIAEDYNRIFVNELHYQGHKQLSRVLDEAMGDNIRRMRIADVGCGTGLCGLSLHKRGFVRELDGVDLSLKMLETAKKLRVQDEPLYDTLVQKNLMTYLAHPDMAGRYDLISAAAVFHYLGDLAPVLAACHKALAPNGMVAFSVEQTEDGKDIIIRDATDSFAYSENYVRDTALKAGFEEIALQRFTLYEGMTALQALYRKKA